MLRAPTATRRENRGQGTKLLQNGAGQVQKAITYTYDAFDRRISKTLVDSTGGYPVTVTERYVYDGTDLVLVLDGDGSMQHRYLHGPEVDQVFADETSLGNLLWLLEDNQHSIVNVVATTGASGADDHPHWSYQSYDAFGNQTVSDPSLTTAIAYTGQVWDPDAQLYYYKARWYDAVTGRFVSTDPLGFAAGDANLQRYVANDPINHTDPTGTVIETVKSRNDGVGFHHVYNGSGTLLGTVSFRPDWQDDEIIAYRLAKKIENLVGLTGLLQGIIDALDSGAQIGVRVSLDFIDNVASAAEFYYDPSLVNAAGMLPLVPGSIKKISKTRKNTSKIDDAIDGTKTSRDACKTPVENPRSRLPQSNGKWTDGTPGDGSWKSDIPAVNAVTGGKPIKFKDGRPIFTPWSKGQIKFEPGVLNGTDSDFDAVYDYIAKEKKLQSRNAAKNYLREAGLTPHHLDNNTIQLIPTDLHGNIPHIGSASDLRGGL